MATLTSVPARADFTIGPSYAVGSNPQFIASADLNGDGKLDLVTANQGNNTVSVLLGNGDGAFAPEVRYQTGAAPQGVVIADVNGNSVPDLVVANALSGTISVLLGNGDGTFAAQVTYPTGAATLPIEAAVADLDGNGTLDIAVSLSNVDSVGVLLGNGNGAFAPVATYPVGDFPFGLVVADLNGNGVLDIVTVNVSGNNISVLLGTGAGAFASQVTYSVGEDPQFAAVADLNGNGVPDIVVTNFSSNTVSVLMGNGDGTLQAQQTFTVDQNPHGVIARDFNGDGKPDLAVTSATQRSVVLLRGNGDGTFAPRQSLAVGLQVANVVAADLNADGKPDLVVSGLEAPIGSQVRVLPASSSGALQFGGASYSIAENGGSAAITVTRSGSTDGQVSAVVSVSGGTATQGHDYTLAGPQSVTWIDGDGANKTVYVPVIADLLDEPNETVQFSISLPSNRFGATLGSQTSTSLQIIDIDSAPTLSLGNVTILEGDGSSNAVFTVTRTGATARTVTVEFATSDGTAKAGADYTQTSGVLTFAPNESSKTITVPIIGDGLAEADETFTMTLANPTNATLLVAQATGVIQNDDVTVACGPRPRVTQALSTGGGSLKVHVEATPLNTAANNPLQRIQFGAFQNATVTLNGQVVISGQNVTLPANTFGAEIVIHRVTAGQASTVPFTVVDSCGTWPTFVGGGPSAGF